MLKIDLHQMTIHKAWFETRVFLENCYFDQCKSVTVICGQGVIKKEIEHWFNLHPRVKSYKLNSNKGSYTVNLKRKALR